MTHHDVSHAPDMPDATDAATRPTPPSRVRDPETRRRDHDEVDRLADSILPDLIERLSASGLGEIEVREDDWRIRLRRPADATRPPAPERGDRQDRARGHAATGDGRTPREAGGARTTAPSSGGNGTGRTAGHQPERVIATSPAVGIFQPRPEIRPGSRVRSGDRVGTVDLLGVPQDVVAPEDGVVAEILASAGEGVEYGQDLVIVEPARGHHDALASAPIVES